MNDTAKTGAVPIKPLSPQAPKAVPSADAAAAPKVAKTPKEPKVPKEPKESNFQKVYPDSAKISLLVAANPKRKGCKAYAIFDLYKDGMSVGDFIKAGGRYSALSWDTGHGFIKVG